MGTTSQYRPSGPFVLLITARRYEVLERVLHAKGYTVVVPPTPNEGVAVCLHNRVAAVLIDEGTATDVEDWSVPRSLKAVSPSTPVLLLAHDPDLYRDLPPGVDCVVSESEPTQVLNALRNCAA